MQPDGIIHDRTTLIALMGVAILSLLGAATVLCRPFEDACERRARIVLVLSVTLFISLALSCFQFTVDDAYIGLRYAQNLADGHGLVYSTDGSQPVEGYTNFLWIVAEAPGFLLRLPTTSILAAVKIVGILFGVGVILGVYRLIRQIHGDPRAAAAGTLFLAAVPYLAFWSVGGLETPMYLFWLVAGLCAYAWEEEKGRHHVASMLFFTLMALTRPEGLLFVLGFMAYETATSCRGGEMVCKLKRLLPGAVVFLLIFGSFFAWRYQFYGYLFPNTFYAKVIGNSGDQLLHRLLQVAPFFVYLLPFAALCWIGSHAWSGDRRWRGRLFAILAMLFVFCFASKREWMPGFRYELAIVPVLFCFLASGICHLLTGLENAQQRPWHVSWVVIACLAVYAVYPVINLRFEASSTCRTSTNVHQRIGEWLKHYAPPKASFAGWDMGANPYFSQIPTIIEIHPDGLLSLQTTHLGHNVPRIIQANPTFVMLPPREIVPEIYNTLTRQTEFTEKYRRIASLKKYYPAEIYVNRSVEISPAEIAELQKEP